MDDQSCYLDKSVDVDGAGFHDGIVLPSLEQSNLDFQFKGFSNYAEGFEFDDGNVFAHLEQTSDPSSFAPFYNVSSPDFFYDHGSQPVLNYINQILMEEENMAEQPTMYHDPLALQAAEKSFYEILGKKHPSSSPSHNGSASVEPQSVLDAVKLSGKEYQPLDMSFMSSFQADSLLLPQPLENASTSDGDQQVGDFRNEAFVSNSFSDSETILQFKKGLEEGNKFLPTGSQLSIDLDEYKLPLKSDNGKLFDRGKEKKQQSENHLRGRKHQLHNNGESAPGRNSKQSAHSSEEVELLEIFDALLVLYADTKVHCFEPDVRQTTGSSNILYPNESLHGSNAGKSSRKRRGNGSEALDLGTTLINCANSVVSGDQKAAIEYLKVIKHYASCDGNPQQRLAVLFANALQARLAGSGPELYLALTSRKISAVEELKVHRMFLFAPFRQMISFFANKMILQAASKATTLHIVDFGISFGFQWPNLIRMLSQRDGGPPRLRITGIDHPQPGFRPVERIEQTGLRLANYCERFNIPLQFQAIASKNWEKIEIDQLELASNEVLAVSCHYHFHGIPDGTVDDKCPRDAVFSLIRKMNPDILVTAILNAQLSAPYFLTRFREALLFYSMIFDLLDNNLPRNDQQRLKFEQEFFGREVMNVVACEGAARICRLETYKQWQIRYRRAGFKCLSLNQDLMKELGGKVQEGYHKDFVFDGDSYWMHMGWKGKILTCCSCWVPA